MYYYWLMCFLLLVSVTVLAKDYSDDSEEIQECPLHCTGIEYECINGICYCADGFYPYYFHVGCVKCPGNGEKCHRTCCSNSLQCWHGVCQSCYDANGKWTCRDTVDQILLVSTTQVIMGTALVLGIVATLVLLFKLCATASLRPLGNGSNFDGRLSIGSLQMYIDERLRDAPPRYSRAPLPTNAVVVTQTAHHNDCFVHDYTVPPPPYTETKEENNDVTLHI